MDTLVVGGGLAGLATAAALRNIANIDEVCVLESSDDSLENEIAGAAIQLGPNGFRALKAIGGESLLEQIYEAGSHLDENILLLPGGASPTATPNTAKIETGYPIVLIRWGILRKLLGGLLPKEKLFFGTGKIVGYTLNDEGTTVKPVYEEGETKGIEASCASKLIIGADGLNSVFRDRVLTQTMVPEIDSEAISPLKDKGRVNLKAVIPAELKDLGETFSKERATFAQFDQHLAAFAGPAGKGYVYWAISIADDKESGSRFLSDNFDDRLAAKNALINKLEASSSDAVDRKWIMSLVERTDPSAILINRSTEVSIEEGNSFVSNDGFVVLVGDAA